MTIVNQIQRSKKDKKLICICLNKVDWNKRVIGYVGHIYLPTKFELQIIDEYGQKRGKKMILFNSIKSLEIGGVYNDSLERLNKNGFLKTATPGRYFAAKEYNLLNKLRELRNLRVICTFFFGSEFSIGEVTGATETEVSIKNISFQGKDDGISIFNISALTKIRIGSARENRVAFLINGKLQ